MCSFPTYSIFLLAKSHVELDLYLLPTNSDFGHLLPPYQLSEFYEYLRPCSQFALLSPGCNMSTSRQGRGQTSSLINSSGITCSILIDCADVCSLKSAYPLLQSLAIQERICLVSGTIVILPPTLDQFLVLLSRMLLMARAPIFHSRRSLGNRIFLSNH